MLHAAVGCSSRGGQTQGGSEHGEVDPIQIFPSQNGQHLGVSGCEFQPLVHFVYIFIVKLSEFKPSAVLQSTPRGTCTPI